MTLVLWLSLGGAALIVGLALVLPCEACRKRRERLKAAYAARRADASR